MVPEGRRHGTGDVWTIGKAAVRPVSLVCGAGGDRASSRARPHQAGGRSSARAGGVDDLPGVATERRHSRRGPGVSRDYDLPPFWWTRVTAYAAAASCSFCIGVM